MSYNELFDNELAVINIGLDRFKETLDSTGTKALQLDWNPPKGVSDNLGDELNKLAVHREKITEANQEAFDRMTEAQPVWVDIATAEDVIPDFSGKQLLHAGPPVTWENMSGPQRGAVIGAALYEGWADSPEEARSLAENKIELSPCHEHDTVGPMAGVVAPSMPVAVVEDEVHGNRAFSNLNEGLGEVLRFGAYSDEVLDRLQWMETDLAEVLKSVVDDQGGVDLKLITAQALQMGDEVHNRNVAATSMFARKISPSLTRSSLDKEKVSEVAQFLEDNDHFYLNLSMAACKVAADAAADIPWSTVLTAMTRNGTEFGIRVSGLGDQWFTAPAPAVDGLFFPQYSEEDAAGDMGDSTIAETTGAGGFAMASAPAITQFVGGSPSDALRYTNEMYEITVGKNPNYTIPALDFEGTPTGIDLLKVIETGVAPVINTGIAHKEPGVGQIGAGLVRAPRECFIDAIEEFCEQHEP